LGEHDYYLRGHELLMHLTKEDIEKAAAIWREGRWWDEISMSILDSDWQAMPHAERTPAEPGEAPDAYRP